MKTTIYIFKFLCYNTLAFGREHYSKNSPFCKYAAVAQLDRVPDSDSGGRGFESRQPYHILKARKAARSPGFFYRQNARAKLVNHFVEHLIFCCKEKYK